MIALPSFARPDTPPDRAPKLRSYRLARNFSIGALFVVTAAAIGLALFNRDVALTQLRHMAEQNNAALTQTMANGIWPSFAGFVAAAKTTPADSIRRDPRTAGLHRQVSALMAGTNVLKVKLYDLTGITAFSTEPGQIGANYARNARFLAAKRGEIVSKLEFRGQFNAIGGRVRDRWVMSSYIPVRPRGASGETQGVAEIYTDVTAFRAQMVAAGTRQIALVAGTFLIVFLLLLAMVVYAERQIRRHHQRSLRLNESVIRAKAANRAKSEFMANMSHELRTPLNAIIGFADMIKNTVLGPIGDVRYRNYANDIHDAGQHLLSVINDVLDLVKVETGKMQVTAETFDLDDLVVGVVTLLRDRAAEAQVELVYEPSKAALALHSDPAKVRQIVINLVANAIKFTEPGGRVSVRAAHDAVTGQTSIVVEDNGIGIAEEDMPLALAPFGQVDSALGRKFDGTGLGLPLSKKLAECLGGDISIASAPRRGTRVTVGLPAEKAADSVAETARAA